MVGRAEEEDAFAWRWLVSVGGLDRDEERGVPFRDIEGFVGVGGGGTGVGVSGMAGGNC